MLLALLVPQTFMLPLKKKKSPYFEDIKQNKRKLNYTLKLYNFPVFMLVEKC